MFKNKVSHFEIPMSDPKKAEAFYGKVFDWKMEAMGPEGYFMAQTVASDKEGMPSELGGINGGFYKRESKDDRPSFVIQTDSIDETAKAIEKAGGKITTPKHPIGEWGFMADFVDPEGNELGLWETVAK